MAQNLPPPPPLKEPLLAKWLYSLWQWVSSMTGGGGTGNHPDLTNLNTTNYYHLTAAQYTELTDGGETNLHYHAGGTSGVASFNTRTGTVTLLAADVTGVGGVLTGDARLSDARPASDVYTWAKAATKPTYTYGEVGAAASSHTHSYAGSTSAGGPASNVAGGSAWQLLYQSAADTTAKLALGSANYMLGVTNAGTGLEYKTLAAGSNVQITHTAGTVTISVPTAGGGTAQALTMNNGGTGDTSGTTFDGTVARTLSYNTIGAAAATHTHVGGDITTAVANATTAASCSGNAATATTLATARNIGGTSFNGSADITPAYATQSLQIPVSSTTTTAIQADRGKCISLAAGMTIPASVFAAGDAVSFYNNTAGNLTLTQGSGLTLRLAGTATTGNRTLAQRGLATAWFLSATEAIISGVGLT